MRVGKRIYYDVVTGTVIQETSERQGSVTNTTIEYDITIFKTLFERMRNTFDVLELEYGQYAQDFSDCFDYRVNIETKTLEFNYDKPKETEEVDLNYITPLSEQILLNTDYLLDLDFRLAIVELGIQQN